jgi:predicted ribosome-associated RNA-binding protein Tma20
VRENLSPCELLQVETKKAVDQIRKEAALFQQAGARLMRSLLEEVIPAICELLQQETQKAIASFVEVDRKKLKQELQSGLDIFINGIASHKALMTKEHDAFRKEAARMKDIATEEKSKSIAHCETLCASIKIEAEKAVDELKTIVAQVQEVRTEALEMEAINAPTILNCEDRLMVRISSLENELHSAESRTTSEIEDLRAVVVAKRYGTCDETLLRDESQINVMNSTVEDLRKEVDKLRLQQEESGRSQL